MKNSLLIIILAVIGILGLTSVFNTSGNNITSKQKQNTNKVEETNWYGFYYKNAIYKTDAISQQTMLDKATRFTSMQDCLTWGETLLENNKNDGFECSFNCRFEKEYSTIICEDTSKMITKIDKGGKYD